MGCLRWQLDIMHDRESGYGGASVRWQLGENVLSLRLNIRFVSTIRVKDFFPVTPESFHYPEVVFLVEEM